jgi:negative regulator of sigma E activity
VVTPDNDALSAALSAVMDGRATPAEWRIVNAAWARDPGLRERWALWHAAADGLRSAELPTLHRAPEDLLDALHARMAMPAETSARRREWFAPLAVAASFVVLALGIVSLQPAPPPESTLAAAPIATPRAQGLGGLSFAQTAAGRTLASDAPPEVIDWGLSLPEASASRPQP